MIAVLAHRGAELIPGMSGLLLAICAGIGLRTFGWVPRWAEQGLRAAATTVLRLSIVLLGLQLVFADMLALGWEVLILVIATVTLTFFGTLLGAYALGTPRSESIMLATGTSICGASAVAAAAAALDRGDGRDRAGRSVDSAAAVSVAVVTLCGTAAMLALPLLADLIGLDDRTAGIWIGAGVHEVGQVVAAGGMVGATALAVAVVVKLARVTLLAPVIAVISLVDRRRAGADSEHGQNESSGGRRRRPPLIPGFILGFLATAALASTVDLPAQLLETAQSATTMLITTAMVGVGVGVDLPQMLRHGGPALALGVFGTLVALAVALIGVVILL